MMINEEWRPVKDYEGLYEVSNMGMVRSLNYNHTGEVRVLCPVLNNDGYLIVSICKNGERKTKRIHRLVAEAFLPNPDNLPVINHRNEIKTDNRVENLEWCTQKYNSYYSKVWLKGNEGASKSLSKPVLQYTKNGEFVAEYKSMMDAERQTGIRQGHISGCCLGKRNHAGNFIWKFKE